MKVFINGRFLSQAVTGVQRAALETVRAMDRLAASRDPIFLGIEAEVLTPPNARSLKGLAHIPVRRIGFSSGHLWEQVELPWHARTGILVSLANAAPLLTRRQCVTLHDASVFAVPEAYSPAYLAWYRVLTPGLGRRAERIVTDSAFSRDELVRRAGIREDKIRVVPLGAEHILAVPCDVGVIAEHELGKRPFILAVSSHSAHKNLGALCEATRHLDRGAYDVVVAGGSNDRVFGTTSATWPEHVKRLGYVTDAQLRALYSHAACFVYPSLYEGFGLPPLEAMMCGCPVVVSGAASLPEVCGDAAVYCDPHDPTDIARSIATVMGNEALRTSMKSRGYQRARGFTWERSARLLTGVVRETWAA
jgi:glycosyltransferase involved in cell wall biosynthesis